MDSIINRIYEFKNNVDSITEHYTDRDKFIFNELIENIQSVIDNSDQVSLNHLILQEQCLYILKNAKMRFVSSNYALCKHILDEEFDALKISPEMLDAILEKCCQEDMKDTNYIDACWIKGRINYNAQGSNTDSINKYRYSRIDLILLNEKSLNSAEFDLDDGSFYNGRNRFANLRDLGSLKIPVIVD